MFLLRGGEGHMALHRSRVKFSTSDYRHIDPDTYSLTYYHSYLLVVEALVSTPLGQQMDVLLKLTFPTNRYVNFAGKSVALNYWEMPCLSSSSGSRIYLYLDGVYGWPERDYVWTFGVAPAELKSLNWLVNIFTGSVGGMRSSNAEAHTVNQYARDVKEMLIQEGAESGCHSRVLSGFECSSPSLEDARRHSGGRCLPLRGQPRCQ